MPRAHSDVAPFSAYAEEAVLAAIMLSSDYDYEVIKALAGIVEPADFFREQNRWIYEACLKAWRAGDPTTVPCIARYMEIEGTLDPAGAEPYLVELTVRWYQDKGFAVAMFPEYAEPHARLIRDYALRRRAVGRAAQGVRDALTRPMPQDVDRTGEMPA